MGYEDTGAGAARQPSRRQHLDGITLMEGHLDFGSTPISMSVTLAGGSTEGTSQFEATSGINQIAENPTWHDATLAGNTLTCTSLASAKSGSAYAVKVKYKLDVNGTLVDRYLHGTVDAAPATGEKDVTLTN